MFRFALAELSKLFARMYLEMGRPAIPPEKLLRALLFFGTREKFPACAFRDFPRQSVAEPRPDWPKHSGSPRESLPPRWSAEFRAFELEC
jgi:hypothetical protein